MIFEDKWETYSIWLSKFEKLSIYIFYLSSTLKNDYIAMHFLMSRESNRKTKQPNQI